MSTDRYGVTHPNDWGLIVLVGVVCLTVGGLGVYLAMAKSREKMAAGWRNCEARIDARRGQ